MADYTKLDLAEAKQILSYYEVHDLTEIIPLSLGISNSNYKVVTTSINYLLKVSNDKNIDQLKDEMSLLKYLEAKSFPLSLAPIGLKDGGFVYKNQEKFGVLFPFVQGIPPGPSDLTCSQIGHSLAQLHSIELSEEGKKLRHHEAVGYGAKQVISYTQQSNCPNDFKETFNDLFPHGLQGFNEIAWHESIIHGDLYYDNTLFQHESLAVILDFEQGGRGEAILDLGISISGTCLEKGMLIAPLVRSFLQGYQEVRTLPPEEKAHLKDAICLGLLSIALWRIKRFKEKNMNPLMSDSYKQLLNRARGFATFMRNETLL
jgi:homoserine kinase type II